MDSTLLKGLRILEALAASSSPRGISELAREMDLTRSNVHRTVQTLVAAGYARPSREGVGYECTLKLFELASALIDRVDVRRVASSHIHRLAALTKETVHLSVLDGADVVYLDKVESPQPVRAYSTIGGRAPAHCVASGKALLSRLPEDELAVLLDAGLAAYTDRSVIDPAALRRELAEARDSGGALNRGEWRAAVAGIASVVFDARQEAVAAVGVSGPADRVLPEEPRYRRAVLATAEAISGELGCRRYPVKSPTLREASSGW